MMLSYLLNKWNFLRIQYVGAVLIGLLGFILNLYLAFVWSPAEYTRFSLIVVVAGLFVIFIDLGQRNFLRREASFEGFVSKDGIQLTCLYRSIMAFLFSIIILLSVNFFFIKKIQDIEVYLLGILFGFSVSICGQVSGVFIGKDQYLSEAVYQFLIKLFVVTTIFLVSLFLVWSTGAVILFWSVSILLPSIMIIIFAREKGSFFSGLDGKSVTNQIGPLLFIEFMTFIYFRTDILIMKFMGVDEIQIGSFALAHKLFEAGLFLFNPIALVSFKYFVSNSNIYVNSPFSTKFKIVMTFAALGGFAATCLGLLGPIFLSSFVKASYVEFWSIYYVLIVCYIFAFPSAILGQYLLAKKLEIRLFLVVSVVAIISFIIYVSFIHYYGAIGAVYGKLLIEIFLLILLFSAIIWFHDKKKKRCISWKIKYIVFQLW